jgi:hypothetical protein
MSDGARVRLLARLAAGSSATWPAPLSGCALQRLQRALATLADTGHPWLVRQLLSSLALVLDPAEAAGREPAWRTAGQPDAQWQGAIDEFFDLVRLRHEMTLSFQEIA